MEDGIVNAYPTPELRKKAGAALVACGLWLRIGFVGASAVAAGLIQLFDGKVKPFSALALAVGGGVLAAVSWWRARTVLEIADGATVEMADTPTTDSDRAMAGT